jgi:hypothetical protein
MEKKSIISQIERWGLCFSSRSYMQFWQNADNPYKSALMFSAATKSDMIELD